MMPRSDIAALINLLCNLEYTGKSYRGSREQFRADLAKYIKGYQREPVERKRFTLEEDKAILKSKNLAKTAEFLGRRYDSVYKRMKKLRRRGYAEQA
jgi:hypothetical protein